MKKAVAKVKKSNVRKSQIVTVGNEYEVSDGFTERVLLCLVVDISLLSKDVERVKVQIFAMAREHGIAPPKD